MKKETKESKSDEGIEKASPKLKDGFTSIPNELYDIIIESHFSPNQSKVLHFILRKTYGWHRKEAKLELKEFMKRTKMLKPNVVRTLKQLSDRKIIIINIDNGYPPSYRIRKNYLIWKDIINIDNGTKRLKLSPEERGALSKPIRNIINTDNPSLSILTRDIINTDNEKSKKLNNISNIEQAKDNLNKSLNKSKNNIKPEKTSSLSKKPKTNLRKAIQEIEEPSLAQNHIGHPVQRTKHRKDAMSSDIQDDTDEKNNLSTEEVEQIKNRYNPSPDITPEERSEFNERLEKFRGEIESSNLSEGKKKSLKKWYSGLRYSKEASEDLVFFLDLIQQGSIDRL